MRKRLICALLVTALLFSITGCVMLPADDVPDTAQFTDDAGRTVALPEEITRIAPSGALAQMVLLAIAPELLVGIASRWSEASRDYIPQACLELPYLGQLYNSADLNVEQLALTDPQLIIDIGEPKASVGEDLDGLQKQTGIPAVFISATLETMPQTYRTLGKLLGREQRGEMLAQFCEKVYNRTEKIMEHVGSQKVRALYVLGPKGLNVLAKDAYHAELLDMLTDNVAVVENPVGKGTGNEVSMEQISLWNPDFVLFAPDSIYSTVEDMDAWREIAAIGKHAYVRVPEGPYNWMGNPPGVQRYLGMIWLTKLLYPEYCDYDMRSEVLEYYRLFYGCELTQQQYENLINHAFTE